MKLRNIFNLRNVIEKRRNIIIFNFSFEVDKFNKIIERYFKKDFLKLILIRYYRNKINNLRKYSKYLDNILKNVIILLIYILIKFYNNLNKLLIYRYT